MKALICIALCILCGCASDPAPRGSAYSTEPQSGMGKGTSGVSTGASAGAFTTGSDVAPRPP